MYNIYDIYIYYVIYILLLYYIYIYIYIYICIHIYIYDRCGSAASSFLPQVHAIRDAALLPMPAGGVSDGMNMTNFSRVTAAGRTQVRRATKRRDVAYITNS